MVNHKWQSQEPVAGRVRAFVEVAHRQGNLILFCRVMEDKFIETHHDV